MTILFNDVLQKSNAPAALLSPALSDTSEAAGAITLTLDAPRKINCAGIGNTNGQNFSFAFNDAASTVFSVEFAANGLYKFPATVTASGVTITTDATYIGRLALGKKRGLDNFNGGYEAALDCPGQKRKRGLEFFDALL